MYDEMPVFDYEDIRLIPDRYIISNCSEADTQVTPGDYTFRLPVIPANIQTIIDEDVTEDLTKSECFYIMHRFGKEARKPFIERIHEQGLIASISVGIKDYEYDFVTSLKDDTPESIIIGIAYGHSDSMINMTRHIKKELPKTLVVTGNIGTPEAVRKLRNTGADATEVGIDPGEVCITKVETGFGTGRWRLAALRWCAKIARKSIIADGEIRTHGGTARSTHFGTTMAMIGSLFARHLESPGKLVEVDGEWYKEYYGSTSEYQKGEHKNVGGKKILLPVKGHLKDALVKMQEDLQSTIFYAGGRGSHSLTRVDYVIVGNSIWSGNPI